MQRGVQKRKVTGQCWFFWACETQTQKITRVFTVCPILRFGWQNKEQIMYLLLSN